MTVPQPFNSEGLINAYGFPTPYTRLFPAPVLASRIPNNSTDLKYPVGQIWVYSAGGVAYILISNTGGTATWEEFAASTGDLFSLTGDSGTATPSAGNIKLAGTANEITTAASGSTVTFTIPATFIAPGSIASTTTLTGGTGITATTGNIAASAGNVSASGTVTGGTGVTATTGNLTATNGNLSLATAGNKIIVATGAGASTGTSGNMSGTPGSVTVTTTASSTTAEIFYARKTAGGTLGNVSISAQDGTGFTLLSTGNETSTFYWWIINA